MSIGYRLFIDEDIDVYKLIEVLNSEDLHNVIKKLIKEYGSINSIVVFFDHIDLSKDIILALKALGIISEIDGKYYIIIPNLKILKSVYTY